MVAPGLALPVAQPPQPGAHPGGASVCRGNSADIVAQQPLFLAVSRPGLAIPPADAPARVERTFMAAKPEDAIGPHDNRLDPVPRQAVCPRIRGPTVAVPMARAAAVRAHPQPAVRGHRQSQHIVTGYPFPLSKCGPVLAIPATHALIAANPDVTIRGNCDILHHARSHGMGDPALPIPVP